MVELARERVAAWVPGRFQPIAGHGAATNSSPNVGIEPAPAGYGQGMATISEPDPRRGSRPPDEAAATESNAPGGIDDELREDQAMRHVTDSLAADYAEAHPAEEIEQVVSEKREHYSDAPVRDFVPILVEREARETLTEPD